MRKIPRKIKQWAVEAIEVLGKAHLYTEQENPDQSKIDWVDFAASSVLFAMSMRGIKDRKKIEPVYRLALESVYDQLENPEYGEEPDYDFLFLVNYVVAHVHFKLINESKAEDIIDFICENYSVGEHV